MIGVLLIPQDIVGKLSLVCKMESDGFQKGEVERIMSNYLQMSSDQQMTPTM